MFKKYFFFCFLIFYELEVFAQDGSPKTSNDRGDLEKCIWSHTHPISPRGYKSILDFDVIDNWINVGTNNNLCISPDGQNFAYTVERGIRNYRKDDSMVVQSTTNSWRQSFAGASLGFFSDDGKQYIFQDKQTLCFLSVGKDSILQVKGVASYKLAGNHKNEWLAYQLKNNEKTVVLQNLLTGIDKQFDRVSAYNFDKSNEWLACRLDNETKELLLFSIVTGKERRFQFAESYLLNPGGQSLVLKIKEKTSLGTLTSLEYVSLPEGAVHTIWSTADSATILSSYNIDGRGKQVVFTVQAGLSSNSIWYYKTGMETAVLKVSNQTNGIDAGLMIQPSASFTNNDRYILFSLQSRPDRTEPGLDASQVDVWDYKDSILQSTQAHLLKESVTYSAIINLESSQLMHLEKEYEKLSLQSDDFAIIKKSVSTINGDRFWENDYRKDSNWLVSLKDGSRHLLPTRGGDYTFWFSPEGKYLVYFDAERQCNYFSYELNTGKSVNISSGVAVCRLGYEDTFLRSREQPTEPVGVVGWLEGDGGLLVYDNYDIWQLDLSGKKPVENITNGYGRSHKILFSLVGSDRGLPTNQPVFSSKDTLLLGAFNRYSKYNGFYRKSLGSAGDPELLSMEPCFMETIPGLGVLDDGMPPLKAADTNTWIVKRQTATEAPNYFVTNDFKTYKQLTNLQPQIGYNWITTALVSFKQSDGTVSQGVLYKPEDFDPTKKYPVIISFYWYLSDRLYQYPTPNYIDAPDIFNNPAWMVSHGYLVFTPDIYFSKGKWGPSTVNTMDGAAKYLCKLPYVDSKHLGAVGHSNSGRFGYYLLTHSHSFAAMSIGSGATDIMRLALSLESRGNEESEMEWAEVSSLGTGLGKLWENKTVWLDHTSVLHADNVTSPLLMYACKNRDIPVEEAVEMFNALRRQEKKAWWLQYDDGGHRLRKLNDMRDFTIRYTQFFDHYLKEAPAPRWMTKGIPAKLKGIESRYELDPAGKCGPDCKICIKWNEKYKKDPKMFEKPISEWSLK